MGKAISVQRFSLYCYLTLVAIIAILFLMQASAGEAQDDAPVCFPPMHQITGAFEDVQRIRVGTEEQSHLLREILATLKKPKPGK